MLGCSSSTIPSGSTRVRHASLPASTCVAGPLRNAGVGLSASMMAWTFGATWSTMVVEVGHNARELPATVSVAT
jgi:hypothetical protein